MADEQPDRPENPFDVLATPTELVRQKVARHSSAARVWQRAAVGAGGAGVVVGVVLIFVFGGFSGAVRAFSTMAIFAGVSVGVALGGVAIVGVYAIKYWEHARESGVGFGGRELAALIGAATALGAFGGVLWFAAELPGADGWWLAGGTALAALVGGVVGAWTAPATDARV